MYFWNINKLKAQLIERPLTEKETLPYIIATVLMYVLLIELISFSHSFEVNSAESIAYGAWDYLFAALTFVISTLGIVWLFKKNKVQSENYFLQRYTALGWVVAVRTTSFILLFCIILFVLTILVSLSQASVPDFFVTTFESNIGSFLLVLSFYLYFYWYFGKHLAEVAQKANYH
jgi:hypothetical protein